MKENQEVQVRRIYDDPLRDDGIRVLVDKLWPRGVSRARAGIDEWCRTVAPSDSLRKWYGHTSTRFAEFEARYREELEECDQASALRHLTVMGAYERLTLLTASKEVGLSHAAVLVDMLRARDRA